MLDHDTRRRNEIHAYVFFFARRKGRVYALCSEVDEARSSIELRGHVERLRRALVANERAEFGNVLAERMQQIRHGWRHVLCIVTDGRRQV